MGGATAERTDFQRIADAVRRRIAAAGTSQRAVGERLGWGRGYVSQLLTGAVGLKVRHLLQILEVLEVPPGDFFAELAEELGGSRPVFLSQTAVTELEVRLRRLVRTEVGGLTPLLGLPGEPPPEDGP